MSFGRLGKLKHIIPFVVLLQHGPVVSAIIFRLLLIVVSGVIPFVITVAYNGVTNSVVAMWPHRFMVID